MKYLVRSWKFAKTMFNKINNLEPVQLRQSWIQLIVLYKIFKQMFNGGLYFDLNVDIDKKNNI